jgi:hypothetical protein
MVQLHTKRIRKTKGGQSSVSRHRTKDGRIHVTSQQPLPEPKPTEEEIEAKKNQGGGDSEKVHFARFAKAVYLPENQRAQIGDYHYSDNNIGTWTNESIKQAVIAFRGTDFSSTKDLFQDLLIVGSLSKLSTRYLQGVKMLKKVQQDFPGFHIALTGHSLGGKIGLNVGTKMNTKSVLFNIGSSPTDKPKDLLYSTICNIFDLKACQPFRKITHYHVTGDPLSASAANISAFKTVRQKMTASNPHGIDNFIPQ